MSISLFSLRFDWIILHNRRFIGSNSLLNLGFIIDVGSLIDGFPRLSGLLVLEFSHNFKCQGDLSTFSSGSIDTFYQDFIGVVYFEWNDFFDSFA